MRPFFVYDLETGYREILTEILDEYDRKVSPRGQETLELDTVVIEHYDPSDAMMVNIGRRLSPTLAAAEALQLIGGFSDPETTVDIAPQYAAYRDGDAFHGAYGVRAGQWFNDAVGRLQSDANSRQAVVTLWRNDIDLGVEGKHDYPCSVYVRFAVRDGKLRTTTHMRSNDAWLGYPYDVYQWTCAHRTVANFLGVDPGTYTHVVDSFHLYERNVDHARALLSKEHSDSSRRPKMRGGVGFGPAYSDESIDNSWTSVQRRARRIFEGHSVQNPTSEEKGLLVAMSKYRKGATVESE